MDGNIGIRRNVIVLKDCPLPSHNSKELYTFKAGIQENLWRCWSKSCRKGKKDGGDVIDLVCEVDGLKPLEAAKKLAGLAGSQVAAPKAGNAEKLATRNKPLSFELSVNPCIR
jgi:hypothetical protein